MQQTQETAAKTKTQRRRNLGFIRERRIVELEPLQGIAQNLVVIRINRINPAEDHWLERLVARQRHHFHIVGFDDRVADIGLS